MNLKARIYIEKQKKEAESKLAARLAFLKEKGMKPEALQRDASLRRIKAMIRKAEARMAAIQAQEKLNQERAQAKVEKVAAKKAERETALAKPAEEPAEKKAKKGKKEKAEKEVKPEKKKEKKEKKPEPDSPPQAS
jgi:hypothetical protein